MNKTKSVLCMSSSNQSLRAQNNEFMCYGSEQTNPSVNIRLYFCRVNTTIGRSQLLITTGANNQPITLTWQVDEVDSLKIITIPTNAGEAFYVENTGLLHLAGQTSTIHVTTGATSGAARNRGLTSEVFFG